MPQQQSDGWQDYTPRKGEDAAWQDYETAKKIVTAKQASTPTQAEQIKTLMAGRKWEDLPLKTKMQVLTLGFGEKAQQYANQAFGPENVGHGAVEGGAQAVWNWIKSMLAEAGETAMKPIAGLTDPKAAAVAASGVVAPEVPALVFGGSALKDLPGRATEVLKHPTPSNAQDLLLTGAQIAAAPAAARGTEIERARAYPEGTGLVGRTVRGILGFGPDVTEQAASKAGEKQIEATKAVEEKRMDAREREHLAQDEASMSESLGEGIKEAEQNARAEGNRRYAEVQQAIGDQKRSLDTLVGAVTNAKENILRTPENIKIFGDIMRQAEHEESVTIQGQEVSQGQVAPDIWQQLVEGGFVQGAPEVPFSFLQGVYTRTGRMLAKGIEPGDVYQAVKSVHESAGREMQAMARDAGADTQLADAQAYWKEYKETFYDKDSPVAKVLDATGKVDPEFFAEQFTKGKAAKRGIEMLGKYDPRLAKLAQSVRQTHEQFQEIPKPKRGSMEMPDKPTVDVREAKMEQLEKLRRVVRGLSRYDLNRLIQMGLGVVGALVGAHQGGAMGAATGIAVAESLYFGGRAGASSLLNRAAAVEWLTRPQPGDVAIIRQLPPEIRNAVRVEFGEIAAQQAAHNPKYRLPREIQQFLNEQPEHKEKKKKKSDREELIEQGQALSQ